TYKYIVRVIKLIQYDRQSSKRTRISETELGRIVRVLPQTDPGQSAGHAERVPADLRHDPLTWTGGVCRAQEKDHPVPLLPRRNAQRPRRGVRNRSKPESSGRHL